MHVSNGLNRLSPYDILYALYFYLLLSYATPFANATQVKKAMESLRPFYFIPTKKPLKDFLTGTPAGNLGQTENNNNNFGSYLCPLSIVICSLYL
jgi:hypothetical protein